MKALILAAGYATRLYPLTLHTPKPLLPVGERTMLDHITDQLETVAEVDEIILVTNERFHDAFCRWKAAYTGKKPVRVLSDGTEGEENRLGAVGDIAFTIRETGLEDDLLVVAGDNLFTWAMTDFVRYFREKQADVVGVRRMTLREDLRRMGVAVMDADHRIVSLVEKPKEPASDIGVYAVYLYTKDTVKLFETYLAEGNPPDAPGHFTAWLHTRRPLYGWLFEGDCVDIGTPESYEAVRAGLGAKK